MKGSIAFLMLMGMIFTHSVAEASMSRFLGVYKNVNQDTRGVTKIKIQRNLQNNKLLKLKVWASCHPQDCAWGQTMARGYAKDIDDNLRYDAKSLVARYDQGFKKVLIVISPLFNHKLVMNVFSRYTDGSGRTSTRKTYVLRRQ